MIISYIINIRLFFYIYVKEYKNVCEERDKKKIPNKVTNILFLCVVLVINISVC